MTPAERLARRFHDAYERLAPSFGYETREDTRAFDPASANGRLMVAVCEELLALPDPDRNEVGKFQHPDKGAPETQRRAALEVYPRTGTARRRVLDAIAYARDFGRTDEELMRQLQMMLNTVRPRRNELLGAGWVADSGKRRRTATGSEAVVWVLTEQGLAQWRAAS